AFASLRDSFFRHAGVRAKTTRRITQRCKDAKMQRRGGKKSRFGWSDIRPKSERIQPRITRIRADVPVHPAVFIRANPRYRRFVSIFALFAYFVVLILIARPGGNDATGVTRARQG
ncbi:MAG: hypothetical protein ACM3U2_09915, partial [Deltaproteobacteria bacterium]